MRKKTRKKRGARLFLTFLCVAFAFCAVWGIVTVIAKVMHYGENATIHVEVEPEPVLPEEPEEEVPPEEPDFSPDLNRYNPDGFYKEDGILKYHGGDYVGIPGIDVSQHQTSVDWEQVRDAGFEFAFIRVGYRGYKTGNIEQDTHFTSHIEGALDAGLDVGVYFFSQALTPEEAKEEAEFVLDQIEGYDISYPVVFDWEEISSEARTDEMNMPMLTTCAQVFCQTVEEAGYEPAIYFNQVFGYLQFNLVSLSEYQFWLAEYRDAPTFEYHFEYWQYSSEGSVPGIEGNVDLNIAFQKKNET